jgi:hypothetical protein
VDGNRDRGHYPEPPAVAERDADALGDRVDDHDGEEQKRPT